MENLKKKNRDELLKVLKEKEKLTQDYLNNRIHYEKEIMEKRLQINSYRTENEVIQH